MPKKDFKETAAHLDRFFSDTDGTHKAQNIPPFPDGQAKPGAGFPAAPMTGQPAGKPKHYRINLKLDADLREYLQNASWKSHKSITQYINDLIQADRATRDT